MNVIATILFPIGVVAIAIAFAAHVGQRTRRSVRSMSQRSVPIG